MHQIYTAHQYKDPNPKQHNISKPDTEMAEEIRAPDKPIRECLLSTPTYHTEDDQLRRVLEESETEYELQHAIIESRRIQEQREDRMRRFVSIKSKFAQFARIDRQNGNFYSDIIRYIEKYESGDFESVSVGEDVYIKFRRTLDNMRISAEEKTRLLELINP